jgi:hypothetical protein
MRDIFLQKSAEEPAAILQSPLVLARDKDDQPFASVALRIILHSARHGFLASI